MDIEFDIEELPEVAGKILQEKPHKIILVCGEMGVGKTTLISYICKKLGVLETIGSPTFSLVNEYRTEENKPIYHFDFYRIESEFEAIDIGFEDYLYSGDWCFIEWSEKIKNLILEPHTIINLELLPDFRRHLKFH